MFKLSFKTVLALILTLITVSVFGVPATPYPITKIQPDGSELTFYLRGDEFFSYKLTMDGYLIREDTQGFYQYAKQDTQGKIISTGIRVKQVEQRTESERKHINTLQPYPDFSKMRQESRANRMAASPTDDQTQKKFPKTGSPKSIVILVNYKDVAFVTPNPQVAFTNLLNQSGYSTNGGTGSARDYFNVASNGVSSPEFVVVGPYTLPNNRAFYGANNSSDDDVKPREMVMDACNAAAADGVNFAQYDTDGDGIVDNVFIYYAGHNEAEGGPIESIWPHRWALNTTLMLNGKRISGYACTSELRGSSGSNMCGIGTFAHEFGHVYGLPDYYATNNAEHHTLSNWNIMDGGAYLNQGRTPPTYSAYDRFYLGWLTPTILNSPQDVSLTDLKINNKAYIITQNGNHNLNGSSPNPVEFFTLENRQKTGWDAFLPRSGMLITRVYYNQSTWNNNGPNNDPVAMGVDIIEADGIASSGTLQGDPFPGSQNITSYSPRLRSGTDIGRPITNIKETTGVITFSFMGGGNPPIIYSDQNNITAFTTLLGTPSVIQKFSVSGKSLKANIQIDFNFKSHFELKKENDPSDNWKKNIELVPIDSLVDTTVILIRYNPIEASFQEVHYDYLNIRTQDAEILQKSISGTSTRPVYVLSPVANEATDVSLKGYYASWNQVEDATGYYLTAYSVSDGTTTLKEGFNNGLDAPIGWTINAKSLNSSYNFAGDSVPSIQFKNTGDYIQTDIFLFPVIELSFYIRSIGENSGSIDVEGWNGEIWSLLDNFNISSTLNTIKNYSFSETNNYIQFKISFNKGIAYVSVDDVAVTLSQKLEYNAFNKWVEDNSAYVDLIVPGSSYYYSVKASDKTLNSDSTIKYENITPPSNLVSVELDESEIIHFSNTNNKISIFKDLNGNVILHQGDNTEGNNLILVYTVNGKLIQQITSSNKTIAISGLSKGQMYILKVGDLFVKFIL